MTCLALAAGSLLAPGYASAQSITGTTSSSGGVDGTTTAYNYVLSGPPSGNGFFLDTLYIPESYQGSFDTTGPNADAGLTWQGSISEESAAELDQAGLGFVTADGTVGGQPADWYVIIPISSPFEPSPLQPGDQIDFSLYAYSSDTIDAVVVASVTRFTDTGFNETESFTVDPPVPALPAATVPEPATMVLFGSGLLGLAVTRRRR